METIKYKYTLEEHLKSFSDYSEDFRCLYSIWNLNKKQLSPALSQIAANFPNFSDHSARHSNNIIMYIECFLGENRIKELGAVDTFMILMASYLHDVGMILWFSKKMEFWKSEGAKESIKYLQNSSDGQLSSAAQMIISLLENKNTAPNDLSMGDILDIWNSVTLINVELTRSSHAKRSKDYINESKKYLDIFNSFQMQPLPKRILICLAGISEMHNRNFDDLFSLLEHSASLYGDEFHPRFIACMIRLGDLLDFDNGRFNPISMKQVKKMPDVSETEYLKHESVTHMYISPTAIEATLICYDDRVYRAARSWFDWLEDEVKDQSLNWTKIAPCILSGLPPVIDRDAIKIKMQNFEIDKDLLNLKFNIKTKKAFQLIIGGGIYENPGCDFLREIVQNAYDATKLQIWKDWNDGYNLDCITNYERADNCDFRDLLSFSDQMRNSIYELYPITIKLLWDDKSSEKKVLVIECEDNGTGISKNTLLRMTENVGESYRSDSDYSEYTKEIPYWLKPTGAFGIGLQSIFLVAPEFIVETQYPGEPSRKILFRSSSNNDSYCSIIGQGGPMKRGTKIRIKIDIENYNKKYRSYDFSVIRDHDFISSDDKELCIERFNYYIKQQLRYIPSIYLKNNISSDLLYDSTLDVSDIEWDGLTVSEGTEYSHYLKQDKGEYLRFRIIEKKLGSVFDFWFSSNLFHTRNLNCIFLQRNVPINKASWGYHLSEFMGFRWNLLNQDTDKFLNLSRNTILDEGLNYLYDFFSKTLLPDICMNISQDADLLELMKKHNTYSAFCMTIQMLNVLNNSQIRVPPIDNQKIADFDKKIVQKNKGLVNNYELVNMDEYYLIVNKLQLGKLKEKETLINGIQEKYNNIFENKILILEDNVLLSYRYLLFYLKEIIVIKESYSIYKYVRRKDPDNFFFVTIPEGTLSSYLKSKFVDEFSSFLRDILCPIEKYKEIIVPSNICGGNFMHENRYTCIISPFSKDFTYNNLTSNLNDKSGEGNNKQKIISLLKDVISEDMIDKIVKYNVLKNKDLTKEKIIDVYSDMVLDSLDVNGN